MKTTFLSSLKLTIVCIVCFSGIYTCLVLGITQIMPNRGRGNIITHNGKTYYENIGQKFTKDKYFWSRPSAVAYNASASGGSNKGPSNSDYIIDVNKRIDTFLSKNPDITRKQVPVELVTASGSGLDPHISPLSAKIQMKRVSRARNITPAQLQEIVNNNTEKPLAGIFGPEKVNVLKLNIALDKLTEKK